MLGCTCRSARSSREAGPRLVSGAAATAAGTPTGESAVDASLRTLDQPPVAVVASDEDDAHFAIVVHQLDTTGRLSNQVELRCVDGGMSCRFLDRLETFGTFLEGVADVRAISSDRAVGDRLIGSGDLGMEGATWWCS